MASGINRDDDGVSMLSMMKMLPVLKSMTGGGDEDSPLVFLDSAADLPLVGDATKLYIIAHSKIYSYDDNAGGYECISFAEPDVIDVNF